MPEPEQVAPTDSARVAGRAELLPEEAVAGSDDPMAQARAVLAESEQRQREASSRDRDDPDGRIERRTSQDTTPDPSPG